MVVWSVVPRPLSQAVAPRSPLVRTTLDQRALQGSDPKQLGVLRASLSQAIQGGSHHPLLEHSAACSGVTLTAGALCYMFRCYTHCWSTLLHVQVLHSPSAGALCYMFRGLIYKTAWDLY